MYIGKKCLIFEEAEQALDSVPYRKWRSCNRAIFTQ